MRLSTIPGAIHFLLSLEVQGRHVIQQQRDARGGDTVGEALLRDLSPVVPLLGPGQAVEERVAVDDRDTELVEDSDAVGLRCRFDQTSGHELEEGLIIDGVEPEPRVHAADSVDEDAGPAGLHDRCRRSWLVRGVEVECGLCGITQFGFACLDESSEVFGRVGRSEVLDDPVLPAGLVSDLHGSSARRGAYLAHEWARAPMIRPGLVTRTRRS